MDSLIDKIKSGYLWDFPGGVYPPERKSLSNQAPIKRLGLANEYIVPVKQHIGQAAAVTVKVGDKVLKGQALTQLQGPMELPTHAPTSGEVIAIEPRITAHPSGLTEISVVIKPDHLDTWCEITPAPNYLTLSKVELLDKLKQAGISGLGGASFPTYVKQANSQPIELLIINGVECEPYITADDLLMREHANEIVSGIEIFTHLLQPKLVAIAIEKNKPEAIAAMEQACRGKQQFVVRAIPTKYPAGGEKQLIQVITGQEVPSKGITADLGIITQNIGTAFAAFRAVVHGEPLIERVVTVTGKQLSEPQNVWARIGTPVDFLLSEQGYQPLKKPRLIMGGPMMGFTLPDTRVPVTKITNCVLAPSDKELPAATDEQACIRCGYCADVCPASLLPQQLYWHSKAKEYEKAQDYKLFDCIECGACAYVCPSEIPLVQYYRVAKADIKNQQLEHEKAEKAKERFNARNERLEREKQERLKKHKQASEARKQSMAKNPSAQDKVAAALARAQAKKQQKTPEAEPNNQTPQATAPEAETKNNAKATAAAAIARAKAKRAAQAKKAEQAAADPTAKSSDTAAESDSNDESQTQALTDKQAKAKAIAEKVKARKAEQTSQTRTEQAAYSTGTAAESDSSDEPQTQALTDKQAKAKAIAEKVKARKAEQANQAAADPTAKSADTATESNSSDESQTHQPDPESETDHSNLTEAQIRQQRVKAAIAKAKAKKQALGDK
ncbi:electron transport complex subunit RsxC [Catenovulum adriaticum]|uniref:Ion-translocating oxidoreductase complex subunit C n=1 Tax=Catenovulum adriaticum TaxID=2984846 RepID=A0ABY7AJI7_9ALTE|nr:electron transport complex subunit RsxC [Catenovulum sp. TS8]WAJ69495.1 electron transport complex subunit RsxC [Catenovulum sp. TS8]